MLLTPASIVVHRFRILTLGIDVLLMLLKEFKALGHHDRPLISGSHSNDSPLQVFFFNYLSLCVIYKLKYPIMSETFSLQRGHIARTNEVEGRHISKKTTKGL